MHVIFNQLSEMANTGSDTDKYRLRAHISKMIAKIPTVKRPQENNIREYAEAELV
jgi:RNA polymerase-interacting CarD/CdnL/TRCF family regulator